MDLTALKSAVSDLKVAVDRIEPPEAAGDDQAAVDELTSEVQQIVDGLNSSGSSVPAPAATSPAAAASTSTSDTAAPPSAAAGVGAWTPPGS